MTSLLELIQGPLYLLSIVLICLPFAFISWLKNKSRKVSFHWITALLLAGIMISLGLYLLALLQLVNSPLFLLFPMLSALLLYFAAVNGRASEFAEFLSTCRRSLEEAWILAFVCALYALGLSVFSIRFHPHFYDSWNYHMTIASLAVSQGGIPAAFVHPYVPSSPPFLELWKTWLWLATGKAGLLEAAQLPFAAGLAMIAYSTFRNLFHGSIRMAGICALFVLFSPKLMENSTSSYLDVFVAFFLSSSIYFLVQRGTLLAALAALAAISFKYSAIGSGFLPLGLALFLLVRERRWKSLTGLAALAPLFLSWYILNLFRFENPLFPYVFADTSLAPEFLRSIFPRMFSCQSTTPCWDGFYIEKIEDLRVLSGMGIGTLLAQWQAWLDIACLSYEPYLGRWGPAFTSIALPGLACSALLYASRWRRGLRPRLALFLLSALCLFFTVKPQESRIALFILPFAFAFGVYWASILLRVTRSLMVFRVFISGLITVSLAWAALHGIFRQERFLAFWKTDFSEGNGSKAILMSMPHPGAEHLYSLARRAQEACSNSPLLFDFHFELQHQYGFAPAASYAFIRKNWRLKTESVSLDQAQAARVLKGDGLESGHCLITFAESRISAHMAGGEGKNWKLLERNALGGLYQLR